MVKLIMDFLKNKNKLIKAGVQILAVGVLAYFGLNNSDLLSKITNASNDNSPQISVISSKKCLANENSFVTKVIDGDTVVVEGGYHVRLLGIDSDEKGYPCYESAKTRLETLVLGKMVKLEKDRTDLDQYGRCLRYIILDNKNIDTQIVGEGLAIARFYEPDTKYKTEISLAEHNAIAGKIGCKWSGASQTK